MQCDGVDPTGNWNENYAIRKASRYGHLPVVERLLECKRVDPTADDNDAIRLASKNSHPPVEERLLQSRGVDPTAENNYAIRWASANGHLDVVERLLQSDIRWLALVSKLR